MSVTLASRVVLGEPAPERATTTPPAAVAATRAITFLRAQAQWLQRGLLHGDDRVAVDIVLSAHDRSHERWVATIRTATAALGDEAEASIATVYAYAGRIAGSLDRGATDLLDPQTARNVRELLAERLGDVTEAAVDALWRAAAEA